MDKIQEKLQHYFNVEKETAPKLIEQLALYLYYLESPNTDLYLLAKILPEDSLIKLIEYFGGDIIRIPTKEEHLQNKLLAIYYYFREIKQYSWPEIIQKLQLTDQQIEQLNTYSLGHKIQQIKETLDKDLMKLVEKLQNISKEEV